MQAPKCRVYEAKQWLLHAQNALLEQTLTEGRNDTGPDHHSQLET
jgi:hypothetical protein